jgi:hypothetical protein
MKKKMFVLALLAVILLASSPAFASLAESTDTMVEGAVEFPVGLVKLVGGLLWTVGEVLILPFTIIF